PRLRYDWTVLPQGMKNSPTICQMYVVRALSPIRNKYPDLICYHYMDDILIAGWDPKELVTVMKDMLQGLKTYGLQIAPEKVQVQVPWKYLGWKILEHTIQPKPITLQSNIKTLNDLQKLVGTINWVRPLLGIDNDMLTPLFKLLKGNPELTSPRELTTEAKQALGKISQVLTERQAQRVIEGLGANLYVLNQSRQAVGLLGQWDTKGTQDPLAIIEWVFLLHQAPKTIVTRVEMFSMLANSLELQIALENFKGQTLIHYPSHKLFSLNEEISIIPESLSKEVPVEGPTLFTDGSGRTGKAAIVWCEKGEWKHQVHHVVGSPQLVEIYAVIQVFRQWEMPLNLVTDSQYVANVARRLEKAWLKEVDNEPVFLIFKQVWDLLNRHINPYYVLHMRSHTSLPGFISQGNARADRLAAPVWTVPIPDVSTQAQLSHEFFHQSARMLRRQFGLTWDTARSIVQMCPDCQQLVPIPQTGVNPRGEKALQIWQSDVTHIGEFGKQKYVHVSIDTFSGALWVTAETGEKNKDILRHWKGAFAALGVPHQIKTDNGPGYISAKTQAFLAQWGIRHITGIPYSPRSQGIVERAYLTLKELLQKQ
ncbi:hypothetical protein FQA23_0010828, partial [Aptenodytes patagonicus]